jgi:hypothetical protein
LQFHRNITTTAATSINNDSKQIHSSITFVAATSISNDRKQMPARENERASAYSYFTQSILVEKWQNRLLVTIDAKYNANIPKKTCKLNMVVYFHFSSSTTRIYTHSQTYLFSS